MEKDFHKILAEVSGVQFDFTEIDKKRDILFNLEKQEIEYMIKLRDLSRNIKVVENELDVLTKPVKDILAKKLEVYFKFIENKTDE